MSALNLFRMSYHYSLKFYRGIAEVPETITEVTTNQTTPPQPIAATEISEEPQEVEYYIASYPYQSVEQGDLMFNAGEIITVIKKEGDWWTGKIGDNTGIFPSNYVQKYDAAQVRYLLLINSIASKCCLLMLVFMLTKCLMRLYFNQAATATNETTAIATTVSQQQDTANANSQIDNEVSQINETRTDIETSMDFTNASNTQVSLVNFSFCQLANAMYTLYAIS